MRSLFKWRERRVLHAVHESDLVEALSSLDILDNLNDGIVSCTVCGAQVRLNNLGAVHSLKDNVGVVCNRPNCLQAAIEGEVERD